MAKRNANHPRRWLATLFFGLMLSHTAMAEPKLMAISMCDLDTARTVAVTSDIVSKAEAAGYRVILRDAQHVLSQQVTDISELTDEAPDCLIVSAVKSIGLQTVLHSAAEKGVRIIMVDRFAVDVPPEDILCSIGMDATWAGETCAQALAEYFDGREARILEVQGEAGASSSNGFALGFRNALCQYPNLQIAGVIYGAFDRVTAKRAIQTYGSAIPTPLTPFLGTVMKTASGRSKRIFPHRAPCQSSPSAGRTMPAARWKQAACGPACK